MGVCVTTRAYMGKERYRKKILAPLSGVLILLIALAFAIGNHFIQGHLDSILDKKLATVDALFPALIAQRSDLMAATLEQIARAPALQKAFATSDREQVRRQAETIFEPLRSRYGITHFYLHTPEKTNYLRAHQPQRFGDPIDRHTLREAAATGQTASGIELGPLGTFTLRVVVPWHKGDRLIGFLELGEEIDHLIQTLHDVSGVELLLTIRKAYLTRSDWEQGMRMLDRPADWDLFPEQVLINTTRPGLPNKLGTILSQPAWPGNGAFDLDFLGRRYHGHHLPLSDAGGRTVGEFLILLDISDQLAGFRRSAALMGTFCILLGGTFFFAAFTLLGRADRQIASSHNLLLLQIEDTQKAREGLEREIGQRRRAEESLQQAHDGLEQSVIDRTAELDQQKGFLEGVLSSVRDILFVTDRDNRLVTMNRSAEELFGTKAAETRGEAIDTILTDTSLLEEVSAATAARTARTFDLQMSGPKEKTSRVVQIRTSPIGEEDHYAGMVFLGQDVTRERQLDRLKSEFISTAAHELRTPMTAILGFSELLREEGNFSAEEQRDFLKVIHDKADDLASLLDDLLDLSRIEAGKPLELHLDAVPVRELIEPTVLNYRMTAKTHTVEMELEEPELTLPADRGKIGQVMENLLSNAVKYSPAGGVVQVTGERLEDSYRVSVSDRGIGMSPEEASKIFEKFYRADSTDSAIRGTGLGMTIVKGIVEAHGGEVRVESEEGVGTTACFTLPLPGRNGQSVS